ncbi:MAG TPA: YihY/virulence factor BrkB family protein [Thermoleophilia bacterium]|nr:YihY/virulence factor BrkB family protein [Thermoleophilia bacterium]
MEASKKPDDQRRAVALWHRALALVGTALRHNLFQLSASLTYYTVLSLFPALFVVVSLLGMIGVSEDTLRTVLDAVAGRTDSQWVVDLVSEMATSIYASPNTGLFLSVGLLAALWSASGYVRSFMWSSDTIYEVTASRSYFQGLPIRLGLAVVLLIMFTAAVAIVTLSGPLGRWTAAALGLDTSDVSDLSWFAWPVLYCTAVLMLTLLFKYAPSRHQPAFLRLLPGAALTVIAWIVASIVFNFYLSHFASYNQVYGALGAAVAALVWAWILNIAVLAGVEVNNAFEPRNEGSAATPTP